jgi:hypothetical protein
MVLTKANIESQPTRVSCLIFLWVAVLNIVFFVVALIITMNFTGGLVSEGKLFPGETYESDFTLTDTKDLTFIFSAAEVSVYRTEDLEITITYPNPHEWLFMHEA